MSSNPLSEEQLAIIKAMHKIWNDTEAKCRDIDRKLKGDIQYLKLSAEGLKRLSRSMSYDRIEELGLEYKAITERMEAK